jgi:hypothetical protein
MLTSLGDAMALLIHKAEHDRVGALSGPIDGDGVDVSDYHAVGSHGGPAGPFVRRT